MNQNSIFIQSAKFFLYLIPFSILIVTTSTFFPFIGGKYYFFRTIVSLALICILIYFGFEGKTDKIFNDLKKIFKQPLVIAVTLFVLFYVLASIFAYYPQESFWSNFERQEGGFQMIHYWLFFILMVFIFRTPKDWKIMFWISIFAAIGMIFYGILSAGFVDGFLGPYLPPSEAQYKKEGVCYNIFECLFQKNIRFQGSLGNSAYVAPYLMFIIFYVLYLQFSEKFRFNIKNIAYIILNLFFLIFFILSQTRGAFLGLIAGIFTFFVYLILKSSKFKKIGISSLICLIILGSLIFYFRNSDFIKNLPGGRFLKINFIEESVQTRFWAWQIAWKGFLDRPILGWGPENFSVIFDKYFDIRYFNPDKPGNETWFDRAHSVIFDYLAETGILGLLSYLGIFAVLLWLFFKNLKINKNEFSKNQILEGIALNEIQLGLILAMIVSYFVQNLVIFEVLPMYLNFFIFIAFLNYLLFSNSLKEKTLKNE